jgi:hypothetical protein
MRLKIAAFAVFLLAGAADGAEVYAVAASDAQVVELRIYELAKNREQCRRLGLASTCTQAQACTAANAPGGASCTAAQARQAGCRIWPDTEAGRLEFITFNPGWLADLFKSAKASTPAQIGTEYCIWWGTQNQTQREAVCTAIGATNSGTIEACGLCP